MSPYTRLVRPLRNGQITLPADFRRALQLDQAPMLQITLDGQELRIRAYNPDQIETGSTWLRDLYQLFAPVRRAVVECADQDINRAIDLALATLRGEIHVPRRP